MLFNSNELDCVRRSACDPHATIAPVHGTFCRRKEESAPQKNMSGVGEAGLVLGLISSTITILEAAHEVYEAASDASGLPKKLRVVAEQIPLLYNALRLAERNLQANNVTHEAVHRAKPVLEQCKKSAASVKDMLDKSMPAKDASRAERLRKAVGLKVKSDKAKEHMEEIFKSMDLLAQNQVLQDAEALEEIKAAMEQLTATSDEEEQPQSVHSGAGAINANTGGGPQENYNNSGSGSQYIAEKQFIGRDQGQESS